MSATVVVPPPNSSSVAKRVPRLTARARALLTAVNLHFAGVAALGVLTLWLAVHLVVVFNKLSSLDAAAMAGQRAQLRAAEIAALPLEGIDAKVTKSTEDADQFYADRLPYAYSQVAAELGAVSKKTGVKLSRVQYAQAPALTGDDALTEVKMDASISGDYRPVMQFINALERDETFFQINTLNLSGQQNGSVNLRLRLTTYLRLPDAEEAAQAPADATAMPGGAGLPGGTTLPGGAR